MAVKQLLGVVAADPAVRRHFNAEARLLARLDHPHVVRIFDFVDDGDQCLLVMELLPGGTLRERTTRTPASPQAACAVALATCAGLQHAHDNGVLHRDVKPDNLMFAANGSLRVTDFGMATIVTGAVGGAGEGTRPGDVVGTPRYVAPEQAEGRDPGPAADVYSTGMVLYELLAGQLPFEDSGGVMAVLYRHVHEPPQPIRDLVPDLPPPVAEVIMTAVATAPGDRFPTAEAFRAALAGAADQAWGGDWASTNRSARVVSTTARDVPEAAFDRAATTVRVPGPAPAGSWHAPWPGTGPGPAPGTATRTFLFTDIEGSTRRWEADPDAMAVAVSIHDDLLRAGIAKAGGRVFKHLGDGVAAVFDDPLAAIDAAIACQLAITATSWAVAPIKVRMTVHVGDVAVRDDDYFGPPLNRCARMMNAGHGGQILVSSATADRVRDRLDDGVSLVDLGEHGLRDLSRAERIFEVRAVGLASGFPPLRSLGRFRHNLPVQVTTFVGRDDDLGALGAQLDGARLVTLVGFGGSGKTRLALQAAADHLDRFVDGTWVAFLAPVRDPSILAESVARTLGLHDPLGSSGDPLSRLAALVGDQRMLLVLDNCEHLVDACAHLATTLLGRCARLSILATSRERLDVSGEHVLVLGPMGTPPAGAGPTQVAATAAGRLFVDRARAVRRDFALTDANARAVASICRRLDGLPLAIELAAARLGVLTPPQIAARLDDALRLLAGGARAQAQHQQTIRATLAWSYDLLEPAEATLLRRLAVFDGGFGLDQAEEVASGGLVGRDDVLDLLGRLVDKSLVATSEVSGGLRFRLLEVVRQFALAELDQAGETDRVRDRHCDGFLTLVEDLDPIDHAEHIGALLVERDNLRAALRWASAPGDQGATGSRAEPERALRLAFRLWRYWAETGAIAEGRRWLDAALAADGSDDRDPMPERPIGSAPVGSALEVSALDASAFLAGQQGQFDEAVARARRSVAGARNLGLALPLGWCLFRLGQLNVDRGSLAEAIGPLEEPDAVFSAEHYDAGVVWSRLERQRAELFGDHAAAAQAGLTDVLARAERYGDAITVAYARACLGTAAVVASGAMEAGRGLLKDGLHTLDAPGARFTLGHALVLATLAHEWAGDNDGAARVAVAAVTVCRDSGVIPGTAVAVASCARVLSRRGRNDVAGLLWAVADRVRADSGMVAVPLAHRLRQAVEVRPDASGGSGDGPDRQRRLSLAEVAAIALAAMDETA